MQINPYFYKARVVRVYDGDTVRVDIDLGLNLWVHNESVRLHRINAPEMRGPEREQGRVSRDFLRGKINRKEVLIETIKDKKGKYGRFIVEIWLEDVSGELVNINDLMVETGHAVYKEF